MSLCNGAHWETRLRRAVHERNHALPDKTPYGWNPWPNTLPKHLMRCVDRLVRFKEFDREALLDLHDMAVIIAQAAYDAGNRQG